MTMPRLIALLLLRRYAVVLRSGPAGTSVCRRSGGATGIWPVALILALTRPLALSATTHVLEGKVVGVHDGDTIKVLSADDVKDSIRLAGIDAPGEREFGGT